MAATSATSKYIIQDLKGQIIENGKVIFDGIRVGSEKLGEPCSILYSAVTKPHLMVDKPHMHDFSQFLCLFGSNSKDLFDFDAEVEMYLDGEKNIITAPSIMHIPAGLPHCPLNFKRIGSPIMFLEIMLTATYQRKPVDK
jgi:hypothetical protein